MRCCMDASSLRISVCEREREEERERERESLAPQGHEQLEEHGGVCVTERKRTRVYVCMRCRVKASRLFWISVCVRERERDKEIVCIFGAA